jgi:hypothetical protein
VHGGGDRLLPLRRPLRRAQNFRQAEMKLLPERCRLHF